MQQVPSADAGQPPAASTVPAPKPVMVGGAKSFSGEDAAPSERQPAGAATTPTSPAVVTAPGKRPEDSDGATVTEDGDGGGGAVANGAAGDATGGGGVTSRGPRAERPPGWPEPLPWPITDPPPACIRLPGPRGMLIYTLVSNQVCIMNNAI